MQNFGINVQMFKPKETLIVTFWVLAALTVFGGFILWCMNLGSPGAGTAFIEDCLVALLFVALGSIIECLRDIRFLLALQTCGNITSINVNAPNLKTSPLPDSTASSP